VPNTTFTAKATNKFELNIETHNNGLKILIQDEVGMPGKTLDLILNRWIHDDDQVGKVAIHELAHVLLDADEPTLHNVHYDSSHCAGQTHYDRERYFCPEHVRMLRQSVTRSFSDVGAASKDSGQHE
jgi:hypothetical protein